MQFRRRARELVCPHQISSSQYQRILEKACINYPSYRLNDPPTKNQLPNIKNLDNNHISRHTSHQIPLTQSYSLPSATLIILSLFSAALSPFLGGSRSSASTVCLIHRRCCAACQSRVSVEGRSLASAARNSSLVPPRARCCRSRYSRDCTSSSEESFCWSR